MLSKEVAERWLLILSELDHMVRKQDFHWGYVPEEDNQGRPIHDADLHRLFEYVEQSIRHDCPEQLFSIRLKAHELTKE